MLHTLLAPTCCRYGEVVEAPQTYDGHHIDVCLRLFTGREKAFSERLLAFMDE